MEAISSTDAPLMLNPSDWQGLLQMDHLSEAKKLQITASEFEATLVRQFLKESMKPIFNGFLDESSVSHEIYRGYFTDVMAQSLSRGEGIGISNVLQTQLGGQRPQESKDENE